MPLMVSTNGRFLITRSICFLGFIFAGQNFGAPLAVRGDHDLLPLGCACGVATTTDGRTVPVGAVDAIFPARGILRDIHYPPPKFG
jgi:hypothetical protein